MEQELLRQLKRQVDELHALAEVGKALTSTLELEDVLSELMRNLSDVLSPSNWSLLLVDEATQELYFELAVGEGASKLKDFRLRLGEGVAGWCALHRETVLVHDVNTDPRFSKRADQVTQFTTQSLLCAPLFVRDKLLGVVELVNGPENPPFNDQDKKTLEIFADYTAIAVENARNYNRILELTISDDVTALYNGRYMHKMLEIEVARARRHHKVFSVLFLDLDKFKNVNDTHGHLVGSQLLREVADLLLNNLRQIDLAFRYGGDEFVAILPETDKDGASLLAGRLCKAISERSYLGSEGLNIHLTGSIGVATFPDDADHKREIIRAADRAMYVVKEGGRNGVCLAGTTDIMR